MEALILAGGLGTRLQNVVNDVPKSMASILGKPFLEYQFNYLKKYGVTKIIMAVGYKKEAIQDYFGDNYCGIDIEYSIEQEQLGTGGAIVNAINHIVEEEFFVLNGDTLFDIDLNEMKKLYHDKQCDIVIALREVDDVSRYGAVSIDECNKIDGFFEKNKKSGDGLINGGIYLIKRRWFVERASKGKFSIEKDVFEKEYLHSKFYALSFNNYFLDIGIPEDYDRAQQEFKRFKIR